MAAIQIDSVPWYSMQDILSAFFQWFCLWVLSALLSLRTHLSINGGFSSKINTSLCSPSRWSLQQISGAHSVGFLTRFIIFSTPHIWHSLTDNAENQRFCFRPRHWVIVQLLAGSEGLKKSPLISDDSAWVFSYLLGLNFLMVSENSKHSPSSLVQPKSNLDA